MGVAAMIQLLEQLWALCGRGDAVVQHPLLFSHPRTGAPAVCLGKISGFAWNVGTPYARVADAAETEARLQELRAELVAFCDAPDAPVYRHDWQDGDVIVFDNLAVAHFAPPETQQPRQVSNVCT